MRSRPPQPVSREFAPPPLARERKADLSIRESLQNSSFPATLRSLRLPLAGGLAMVLATLTGTVTARGADDSAVLLLRHSPGGGLVWVAGREPGDGEAALLPLADQLADGALLAPGQAFSEAEILRSLRPLGFALLGDGARLEKTWPEGYDDCSSSATRSILHMI